MIFLTGRTIFLALFLLLSPITISQTGAQRGVVHQGLLQHSMMEGRALPGSDCWFPNYYCSITPDNVVKEYKLEGAENCYNDCKGNAPDCKYFTHFTRRGVSMCYHLNECGEEYQVKDDYCLNRGPSCISGPSDCTSLPNNADCTMLTKHENKLQWQCEDGGLGIRVDGYQVSLSPGSRCLLSCDSWQSWRRYHVQERDDEQRGFLYSVCQANGTWSETLPNDQADLVSYLHFPSPDELFHGTEVYPLPNELPPSCGCPPLALVWPPPGSVYNASDRFYYNPRDLPGADMECYDEVQNSHVMDTGRFVVKSNNTCVFLCDTFYVATLECIDGTWSGGTDKGFWCYDQPGMDQSLGLVSEKQTLTDAWLSSVGFGGTATNCLPQNYSPSKLPTWRCGSEGGADTFPWLLIKLEAETFVERVKLTLKTKTDDRRRAQKITVKVINEKLTEVLPAIYSKGYELGYWEGPADANTESITIESSHDDGHGHEASGPGGYLLIQMDLEGHFDNILEFRLVEVFGYQFGEEGHTVYRAAAPMTY